MRAGLTVSGIGHVGLLVLAVVGIGMTSPLDPTPVESIAVDLISIEEFSSIRRGVLDSQIVETEAPAVVDTEVPAEIAQPTGNTAEDQPTPEATEIETPAPTQQTAPEPVPEPEPVEIPTPEPEPVVAALPEPAPEPEPEPEPEPVPEPPPETPEPPELAAPAETPDPSDLAPVPRVRTASLDQKRAEFKKQQEDAKKLEEEAARKKREEEERVREAKRKADEAARQADQVANIINTEDSRGATTGSGGEASLGRPTGQAARLSQSAIDALIAQIKDCLSVPLGAAEAGTTAVLEFNIDNGGRVVATPTVARAPATSLEQALASAAQRAVMRCGPYQIAAGQQVRATFDPRLF